MKRVSRLETSIVRRLTLLTFLGIAACGSYTQTVRIQEPMIQIENAEVALMSVDFEQSVYERAPSDFGNIRGMVSQALVGAFSATSLRIVDRTDLGYRLPIELRGPDNYVADAPQQLPMGVREPLLLGVRVVEWRVLEREDRSGRSETVPLIDIVASMWTRQGEEVHTQRVTVDWRSRWAMQAFALTPDRGPDYDLGQAEDVSHTTAALDESENFRESVTLAARAYAFPFGRQEVRHIAYWDDTDPSLEIAIEQADDGQLDAALTAFESAETSAPANYNAGVIYELQGRDDIAMERYDAALQSAPDERLYNRARDAVVRRISNRRVVVLPSALPASRAPQAADDAVLPSTSSTPQAADDHTLPQGP